MAELFNTQRFAEIGAAIYQWLLLNVFVLGNAVQLVRDPRGARRCAHARAAALAARRAAARAARVVRPVRSRPAARAWR